MKNEGIELDICKGIAGIKSHNIRTSVITSLDDILFINYLHGKSKYKIDKIRYIILDRYPYHVVGVTHIGDSRTKRKCIKIRRDHE